MTRRLAVLSMHTSPLAQPGTGDGGGMNVYVRELGSALAQAGVGTDVYVRRWAPGLPDEVEVEPGLRVLHVDAGPPQAAKEDLVDLVDEFAAGVRERIVRGGGVELLHANYWLSGVAGHRLKHDLGIPLVSTFHTLARVKVAIGENESAHRDRAEAEIAGCSDSVLASCSVEVDQLVGLYGVEPSRVELVPPGVDHAFFSPGERRGARTALGHLDLGAGPVLLFVGRIQPLKGLDVAVRALAALDRPDVTLVVVGGASGPEGEAELDRTRALAAELGVDGSIRWVPPQPHHLLSTYYRAADVVLVPSRSESFGLVALEAAACGVPVVAAAVGGLTTLIDHGRTGYLVEDRDPEVMAAHVAELLARPDHAAQLGTAAATRARGYTWSTAAARLRRLYADLTAREPVDCR